MITRIRSKLSYSNVIATIALFAALSGVAVAANVAKNSVGPKQLKRGAVTTPKLRNGAVKGAKIANGGVIPGKLAANAVGAGNIGNGAVTSAKLAKNSVINSAIAAGVVGTNKLGNEVVTTAKLANGSVTAAKLSGEVGPLVGPLKSGQTLRGIIDLGDESKLTRAATSFQFPLLNTPTANILAPGTNSTACPGLGGGNTTPQAAAGQLCVYITAQSTEIESLTIDTGSLSRLGFGLLAKFKATGDNFVQGLWAVTAP